MSLGFRGSLLFLLVVGLIQLSSITPLEAQQTAPAENATRTPDVIFVPTPDAVVEAMLEVAKVTKHDVVYELGCGDGRIPVAAAQTYGARAVCIDIDPQRVKEAEERVRTHNVEDRVTVMEADLFTTDISEATVVTLYLLPSLNQKLIPKLKSELKPGTRIVSHAFDMGDWKPEKELTVDGRKVYFWTIPRR
jgi:cyclopropane fatty-acyl-phospholipid synthase-like methyltransferase